ncbi:hypothetical protein LYNGBM3L_22920 [Moorena producens 3L]|uniref:Uncharacterized protein n=1 Tax=Moorena producens 3L TaxID=489825 RepID=F4XMV5_9CYAN|nr:hypothetical protein LYNGBM3L_22920 [Moorena producens 3L]
MKEEKLKVIWLKVIWLKVEG